ncbi:hypothetical protein D9M68_330640 [compost metagenome]
MEFQFLARSPGTIGQRCEQRQRHREVSDCLGIGRALHSQAPSAVQVFDRLGMIAALAEVIREFAAVFVELAIELGFDGPSRALVQRPAPLAQQRAVGDLLGQRVLEAVLHLRKRWLFVDEFSGLQSCQQGLRFVLRTIDDPREQAPGKHLADDRQRLQQSFFRRLQPVDAGREHTLHSDGDVKLLRHALDAVMTPFTTQDMFLDHVLDDFLDEERIPLRLLQNQLLQPGQTSVVAEHGTEQFPCFSFAQGIQAKLGEVTPAAPLVAVLRPEIDEQQDACADHAFGEETQKGLGFRVEPL